MDVDNRFRRNVRNDFQLGDVFAFRDNERTARFMEGRMKMT